MEIPYIIAAQEFVKSMVAFLKYVCKLKVFASDRGSCYSAELSSAVIMCKKLNSFVDLSSLFATVKRSE